MTDNPLYAVVLAAGLSSRYGSTKQLAMIDGKSLVARAVQLAESACGRQTVLVAGHDWQSVTAACKPLNGFVALNSRFAEGMSTSIATGVKAVSETAAGVLLLLADQPLISEEHLAALAEAWNSSRDSVCVTTYAGTEGPPVIFPARLFPELIALRGDRGAKPVLDANRQSIVAVPCEVAAVDIDTPEDLRRIRGQSTFI